ncbi:MAG: hypothetical protein AABZ30_16170 [Myxococcota bacterium]
MALHVFVETNWVVDYLAPAHHQKPDAVRLVERAAAGELQLHLPGICLGEALSVLRRKYQPKEAAALGGFRRWAKEHGLLTEEESSAAVAFLEKFAAEVGRQIERIDAALQDLRARDGVAVFALSQEALLRSLELATLLPELKPFDQAILAAVLVRADELRLGGDAELAFCELDSDLKPWDKDGNRRVQLADLYDTAGIWVYGDFRLEGPVERPAGWPG